MQFACELQEVKGFEIVNDIVFNQVLVHCETDDMTLRTMESIQELIECWAGGSMWNGRKVIRVRICSWATTSDDFACSVQSFIRALNENELQIKATHL